jgi:hypothetical protein
MIIGPNPSLLQTKRDPFVSGAPKPKLRVKVTVIISSTIGSKSCDASAVVYPAMEYTFLPRCKFDWGHGHYLSQFAGTKISSRLFATDRYEAMFTSFSHNFLWGRKCTTVTRVRRQTPLWPSIEDGERHH